MFHSFNFRRLRKRFDSTIWPHFTREFEAPAVLNEHCLLLPDLRFWHALIEQLTVHSVVLASSLKRRVGTAMRASSTLAVKYKKSACQCSRLVTHCHP